MAILGVRVAQVPFPAKSLQSGAKTEVNRDIFGDKYNRVGGNKDFHGVC